jgi:hypothetical protein
MFNTKNSLRCQEEIFWNFGAYWTELRNFAPIGTLEKQNAGMMVRIEG